MNSVVVPATHEDRQGHSGVPQPQHSGPGLPDAVEERYEVAVDLAFEKRHIQLPEHVCGREALGREATQNAAYHRAIECCWSSLSAYVTQREHVTVSTVGEKIVQVSAELPRGLKTDRDLKSGN